MFDAAEVESERLRLQSKLDAGKTQAERNRMGQFATPPPLATDIAQFVASLVPRTSRIRFLDPAFGTGSFYSAILEAADQHVELATCFEIDPYYGEPATSLWRRSGLDLRLKDFTRQAPEQHYNVVICNPPYVRHHHLVATDKAYLGTRVLRETGINLHGLTGLYCYFMLLSHAWMEDGGIAAWLVPSEFLDVNYGRQVKRYLSEHVKLLRIHRFDPRNVQFDDALVSSAVIVFEKAPPSKTHNVAFTYGGTLNKPASTKEIALRDLIGNRKWSGVALSNNERSRAHVRLGDLFHVKRGLATGDNSFFILTDEQIKERNLPREVFRPILPSSRYVEGLEIKADEKREPLISKRLYLLDTKLPEDEVKSRYPALHSYLLGGEGKVSVRYLCRKRSPWYSQESRPAPPLLCTYMGRGDKQRPFRFLLNESNATATNVYLLLYPRPDFQLILGHKPSLVREFWERLNKMRVDQILEEGRVYGGGLHKLEPSELSNLDVTTLVDKIAPELRPSPSLPGL